MKPFSQALHLCLQSLKEQCIWVPLGQAVVCDELITDQSETWKAKRSGPGIIRRSAIQAEVTGSTRPQEGTSLLCWRIRNSAHVACEQWASGKRGGLNCERIRRWKTTSDRGVWILSEEWREVLGVMRQTEHTPSAEPKLERWPKWVGRRDGWSVPISWCPSLNQWALGSTDGSWVPGIASGVTPRHHTCHYISKTKASKRPSPLTLPQVPDLIQHLAPPQKYCPSLLSVLGCATGFGPPSTGTFYTFPVNHFWGQKYRELSLKFLMHFLKETGLINSAAILGHVSWYEEENSWISAPRGKCDNQPLKTYF